MGNGKGLAGLIAVLGLVLFMSKDREPLTAGAFAPTFDITYPSITYPGPPSITYEQYFEFATAPQVEVEADPETELTVSRPITQTATQVGVWRTIGGKIPTPSGGLIPLPTVHVGRTAVEKMLESIGDEDPAEYFADVEHNGTVRRAVGARLTPL